LGLQEKDIGLRPLVNKQLLNVVEVIPFYGIGLNLTDFLHTMFSVVLGSEHAIT